MKRVLLPILFFAALLSFGQSNLSPGDALGLFRDKVDTTGMPTIKFISDKKEYVNIYFSDEANRNQFLKDSISYSTNSNSKRTHYVDSVTEEYVNRNKTRDGYVFNELIRMQEPKLHFNNSEIYFLDRSVEYYSCKIGNTIYIYTGNVKGRTLCFAGNNILIKSKIE